MILCVESIYGGTFCFLEKPFDYGTAFDSNCSKIVVKYLGEFNSYHLYLDLASGCYLQMNRKLVDSENKVIWRIG